MNPAPLVLRDFNGVIEITADAYELKRKALALARGVTFVKTPEQQANAVAALRELKEVRSGIEATRKAVKAPVLALEREIDNKAKTFVAEVDKDYGRISGLVNHYQQVQHREKAERERELEKGQNDGEALRQSARDLRDRAAQIRMSSNVVSSVKQHDEMITQADDLLKQADVLEAKAIDLIMSGEFAVVPVVDKPKGLAVRRRIDFQVLDALVFAQAWPAFWKVSANGDHANECMVVDRMKVLDALNAPKLDSVFHRTRFPEELSKTDDPRLVSPAGLRVFEDVKAHIR
jgi:hypothetical protein